MFVRPIQTIPPSITLSHSLNAVSILAAKLITDTGSLGHAVQLIITFGTINLTVTALKTR